MRVVVALGGNASSPASGTGSATELRTALAVAAVPLAKLVGAGATLKLVAKDISFDQKALTATANQPFAIQLTNNDPAGVPHNVEIRDASGTVIADPPTVDGGQSTTYTYSPLPPGTYTFICKVHPVATMTGTLTVH